MIFLQGELPVEEIKRQRKVQELFALLSVALGALSEDDIQELTSLSAWDLADLPWQATRWFSIQMGVYSFAHPLLADEFQGVLGRQADSAQGKLIEYCAKWQEHHSAYALRHYAEHLGKAKRWEKLYEIALNRDFASTQRQQLPDEPDLSLKTVRTALLGAAEEDNAEKMAEFLLVHAHRLGQTNTQESPLDALRSSSLERAWKLAEQYEIEYCILWCLLLAWELVRDTSRGTDRIEQARSILKRLQQKDLPRLQLKEFSHPSWDDWKANLIVYPLMHILAVTKDSFTTLPKLILKDKDQLELCINLAISGKFAAALETAKLIDDSDYRTEALIEIAKAQARAEKFTAAHETVQLIGVSRRIPGTIEFAKALVQAVGFKTAFMKLQKMEIQEEIDNSELALVLIEIANVQAQAENFAAALETVQLMDVSRHTKMLMEIAKAQPSPEKSAAALQSALQSVLSMGIQGQSHIYHRSEALIEIAKAQAQAENFTAALETVQLIDDSYCRSKALIEIAKAQAQAENFTAALETVQPIDDIDDSDYRTEALMKIAKAQAQAENFTAALKTAQLIEFSLQRAETLMEIIKVQAQADNLAALKTAQLINDSYYRALALIEIAKAQAQTENFAAALTTAQLIEFQREKALIEIVKAQAQAENFAAALETAQLIESWQREEALIEIIKAQAQAENFAAALQTVQMINNFNYRALALIEIAKAQAQAKKLTAALTTAQLINDSYYRALALIEIAKAQPLAENFAAALTTAEQIYDYREYQETLMEIAKAQAQAENFAAALQTVKLIDDSYYRPKALMEIAKAQAQAENFAAVLETAQKILIDRKKHLPDIAAAFVETGDKESFKQLLIPCAYYLDAAYQMCGYLVKLYPAQATDIAKVFKEFTVSST